MANCRALKGDYRPVKGNFRPENMSYLREHECGRPRGMEIYKLTVNNTGL